MRLQRMIALSSELSRRAAENAIASGEVTVNGKIVTVFGSKVDPSVDIVFLKGKKLNLQEKRYYVAFNKPRGMLVTKSDPMGRPTIWDHLEEWRDKLNSVGRLDYDSEGLIILTDDGDFLNKLTHPRHEIWKTYQVRLKGIPRQVGINKLQDGVELTDGATLPAKARRIDKGDENALLEISIREGKNRQIRRMCEKIGFTVVRLKRISIGPVKLGRLKAGEWRYLKPDEVASLGG